RDYDLAIRFCLDHIDRIGFMAGTHNEASSKVLVDEMNSRQLPHDHPHIHFAQLLGMSDNLSFNLAAAGYRVAKYMPYGPVKAVMPYLFRRAQENTSVAGQTGRELSLIAQENTRRTTKRYKQISPYTKNSTNLPKSTGKKIIRHAYTIAMALLQTTCTHTKRHIKRQRRNSASHSIPLSSTSWLDGPHC